MAQGEVLGPSGPPLGYASDDSPGYTTQTADAPVSDCQFQMGSQFKTFYKQLTKHTKSRIQEDFHIHISALQPFQLQSGWMSDRIQVDDDGNGR